MGISNVRLDSAINSNKELFQTRQLQAVASNKSYLTQACKADNFELAQSSANATRETKKKKRAKVYKIAALSATALVGIAALLKTKPVAGKAHELAERATKGLDGIRNSKTTGSVKNAWANVINVKDDYWNKLVQKMQNSSIAPIRGIGKGANGIGNWITGVYKSAITKSFEGKYNKTIEELQKHGYDTSNMLSFNKWFEQTNSEMYEIFQKKGERVTDKFINKDIFNKMGSSVIADDKISSILQKEGQYVKVPQGASKELEKTAEEFNKMKATLLAKMRDVNCGSAPTDLLTIATSTLGMGVAVATAKDKEERKSTTINLGIPLFTTLAATTYGTMRCLSGVKSMIFGLAAGTVAKGVAKAVDKATQKDSKN